MQIIGVDYVPVTARTESSFGTETIEVAIALDTTGSMEPGNKLVDAKKAASDLVDTLFGPSGVNPRVKVALVPFHYYVNIGTAYKNASWLTGAADVSVSYAAGCYDTYPNAIYGTPIVHSYLDDGVPKTWTETPVISYGTPVPSCWPAGSYTNSWGGVVGSRNYPADLQADVSVGNPVPAVMGAAYPAPLMRLSNDPAQIKAQINALSPSGETFIAPGLLWGWRVLSPNLPFADGAPYNGNVKKILILMTDGANTVSPSFPNHDNSDPVKAHDSGDATSADRLTADTCANIKAPAVGITVYTIAFQVTDTSIRNILQSCASTPANYYNATSNAAMLSAFAQIANSLMALSLSK